MLLVCYPKCGTCRKAEKWLEEQGIPAEYRDIKESMRKRLMEILRRQGDPRVTGNGDIFDRYPYSDPEYENFYEKTVSGEIQDPWSYTDWIEPTDYDEYVRKLEAGEIKPVPEFTSGINW